MIVDDVSSLGLVMGSFLQESWSPLYPSNSRQELGLQLRNAIKQGMKAWACRQLRDRVSMDVDLLGAEV